VFYFFLLIALFVVFNELVIKKNILLDNTHFSKHKKFTISSLRIPFSAGFFLILFIILFNKEFNLFSMFLIIVIFFSGFLSDIFKNFSPLLRLFIQITTSYLFITSNEIFIIDTRINSLDILFSNYNYLSVIFTIFCIIVLINGSNFIDGVNINTIGYYIVVYLVIFYICSHYNFAINFSFLIKLILFLLFLLILNIYNKTQLGDGGSYLLAFFSAIYLIKIANNNNFISPYFIILLLWYPCFENLFSIVRKIYQNKKVSKADNFHLHQLIFTFLKKKKLSNINNLTGLIITIYNTIVFLISIPHVNDTKVVLIVIMTNVLFYIFLYNKLTNDLLKKSSVNKN
jgi:UDP-N-acetylmuramyl pentapeptide phosphotransferase/UDP-N-acetylglucosamine-1-phosphate transferase